MMTGRLSGKKAATNERQRKNVALLFPMSLSRLARLTQGVIDYARDGHAWNFVTSPPTLAASEEFSLTVRSLRDWPGDGVIGLISDPADMRVARKLKIPVVNISGAQHHGGLPRVIVDNYAAGRMAADYFLERGLRRLAYCGQQGPWYSSERCRGFRDRATQAGVPCDVFETKLRRRPPATWRGRRAPLDRWLKSLAPPVGILAVHDFRARAIVEECLWLGLDVPHEIAVLGFDDDPTVCEFCQPSLSSISHSSWRIGYEAAALLDRLMSGHARASEDILIPPGGIITRRSTDTIAVDDPHVTMALRYMHDHAGERFDIAKMMTRMPVSRRRLETQFRRLLRCSPYEYLCRLRVEQVKKKLVQQPKIKLRGIATSSGFANPTRMALVFRRVTGLTPTAFRQRATRGIASALPSEVAESS